MSILVVIVQFSYDSLFICFRYILPNRYVKVIYQVSCEEQTKPQKPTHTHTYSDMYITRRACFNFCLRNLFRSLMSAPCYSKISPPKGPDCRTEPETIWLGKQSSYHTVTQITSLIVTQLFHQILQTICAKLFILLFY